jgi:hypothetical protein
MYVICMHVRLQTDAGASQNVSTGKSERIPSHDFRAWDKYDADREVEGVDNGSKKTLSSVSVSPKGIPMELSETGKHLCTPPPATPPPPQNMLDM